MILAVCVGLAMILSVAVGHEIPDTTVAFSAILSKHTNLPKGAVVVFDTVYINFGNGYNSKTGVFTATKAGVYVFHLHTLSVLNGVAYVGLFLNDVQRVSSFGKTANTYASGGNTVILQLRKNDRVNVKTHGPVSLFGDTKKTYTTFSGNIIVPLKK